MIAVCVCGWGVNGGREGGGVCSARKYSLDSP